MSVEEGVVNREGVPVVPEAATPSPKIVINHLSY